MYSPGTLNVAVVVALPPSSTAIFGLGFSNFTAPGPRNIVHVSESGGGGVNSGGAPAAAPAPPPRAAPPRPRPRPSGTLIFGPSSVAQTVSVSGAPTVAVNFSAM